MSHSTRYPDAIRLGYKWNPDTGEIGAPVTYPLQSGMITIAPTLSGKGVGIEIPTLASFLGGMSVLSVDPTGQNAADCAEARRRMGHKVVCVNPTGAHTGMYPDLASVGCNPMVAGIDVEGPRFYDETVVIADALNWSEKGDIFFTEGGKDLVTCLTGYVRWRDGDDANITEVMRLLMEGEKRDANGVPTQGLRHTAAHMVKCPVWWIAALAGRFLGDPGSSTKTIDSIKQTAQTAARSMLSDQIRADLGKNGVDFAELTQRPVTVFIIPPQTNLAFHAVWLRLIVATALNSIYRQMRNVKVTTLIMLSEFPALGSMPVISDALAQANKYGLRTWCILQNWGQLTRLYEHDGATGFIGNSGCMIAFAPNEPFTSKMLSDHTGEIYGGQTSYSENQYGELNTSHNLHREKLWPPEKIQSLPRHHALVWFSGNPHPVPVFAKPYFQDRAFAHVRPDPFHRGKSNSPAQAPVANSNRSKAKSRLRWLGKKILAGVLIYLAVCVVLIVYVIIANHVQGRR